MTASADYLAATAYLAALESDTPKLTALQAQHAQAVETIRQQVRAETATFDELVTAESKLAAASNLLEQHTHDVAEARAQAEALGVLAAREQDAQRLAVLRVDLAASLDRRHQLAGQFIQGLEDGLSALVVNATARHGLAAEAAAILGRLGERLPHEVAESLAAGAPTEVHDHLMLQLRGDALAEAMRDCLRDGLRRVLVTLQDQMGPQG